MQILLDIVYLILTKINNFNYWTNIYTISSPKHFEETPVQPWLRRFANDANVLRYFINPDNEFLSRTEGVSGEGVPGRGQGNLSIRDSGADGSRTDAGVDNGADAESRGRVPG